MGLQHGKNIQEMWEDIIIFGMRTKTKVRESHIPSVNSTAKRGEKDLGGWYSTHIAMHDNQGSSPPLQLSEGNFMNDEVVL